MADFNQIRQEIDQNIYENQDGDITGEVMNEVLNDVVDAVEEAVTNGNNIRAFKGWWPDLATLKAAITAEPGDSAYVKDVSPATTWSIYIYDSTASSDNYWADSGTDADTSDVQTFASGEEVNETYIDDTHLANPKSGALPIATGVMQLKDKLQDVTMEDVKVTPVLSGEGQNVFSGYVQVKSSVSPLATPRITSPSGTTYKHIVLDIEGYTSVRFLGRLTNNTGSDGGWAFYDSSNYSNGSYLTDKTGYIAYTLFDCDTTLASPTTKEYIAKIPEGAKYLKLCYDFTQITSDKFYCYLQKGFSAVDKSYVDGKMEVLSKKLYGEYTGKYSVDLDSLPYTGRQFHRIDSGDLDAVAYTSNLNTGVKSKYLNVSELHGFPIRLYGSRDSTTYSFITFTPVAVGTTPYYGIKTLGEAVQLGVLSKIHYNQESGKWNPVIILHKDEMVDLVVPDDAKLMIITLAETTDSGGYSYSRPMPSKIETYENKVDGDIDDINKYISNAESKIPSTYYRISFVNGTMGEDGVVNKSDKILISNPIGLTDGYCLQLSDEYCIYRMHMIDTVSGKIVNYIGEEYYTEIDGARSAVRTWTSNAKCIAKYAHIFEVVRRDGEDAQVTDNIVDVFFDVNNIKNTGFSEVLPQNTDGVVGISEEVYRLFKKRADVLQRVVTTPIEKVPSRDDSTQRYLPNGTIIGMFYSDACEFDKYVPNNVSLRTFLTSLQNRRSLLYTEDIEGNDYKSKYGFVYHGITDYTGAYYGAVCTSFTTYLLGEEDVIQSSIWGNSQWANDYFVEIAKSVNYIPDHDYEYIVSHLQPMDFFWNEGHCWACRAVYEDADGNRIIVTTEQGGLGTLERYYTPDKLVERLNGLLAQNINFKILRKKNWIGYSGPTDIDMMCIAKDNMRYNPLSKSLCDPDINTFAGDYAAFAVNSDNDDTVSYNNYKACLNIHRGGAYDRLQIFNESSDASRDTPVAVVDISSNSGTFIYNSTDIYSDDASDKEDWIIVDLTQLSTPLGYGKYKARVVKSSDSSSSGFVHFEMVDVSFTAVVSDNSIVISFGSAEGVPYVVRHENESGLLYSMPHRYLFTSSDIESGTKTLSWQASTYKYIKLLVKSDYGVVCKRLKIWD